MSETKKRRGEEQDNRRNTGSKIIKTISRITSRVEKKQLKKTWRALSIIFSETYGDSCGGIPPYLYSSVRKSRITSLVKNKKRGKKRVGALPHCRNGFSCGGILPRMLHRSGTGCTSTMCWRCFINQVLYLLDSGDVEVRCVGGVEDVREVVHVTVASRVPEVPLSVLPQVLCL